MEFFSKVTNIDFMRWRHVALGGSALANVLAVVLLFTHGLNLGIDFTGGVLLEVEYPQQVELAAVREDLTAAGYPEAVVQHFGSTRKVQIRIQPEGEAKANEVRESAMAALRADGSGVELRASGFVGPQVGAELVDQGTIAAIMAMIAIGLYVWMRFEIKLAGAALIATLHDVLMTIGFFSLTQLPFDLTVFAAILAIIGYSLNDTVVVFDRLRECFREMRRGTVLEMANAAINQTISRTIMTGVTTMLVLGSLYWFGSASLQPFAIALVFGVIVGTYSSVYVASASALAMGLSKEDMMPPKRDDTLEEMP
jgi:preprotein translocase subunit SecF